MKVPDDFILAALFSEIGRFQMRAERIQGSVREISCRWLEKKKILNVAAALDSYERLITKAARLALGVEIAEENEPRLAKDAGEPTTSLVSLFSKIPPLPEKVLFFPLSSPAKECVYPEENPEPPRYAELWQAFNTEIDPIRSNLTSDTALVLLENYTARMPYLLSAGENPVTDPFSDISLFDHLKATAAIASCLYACGMDMEASGGIEKAAEFDSAVWPAFLLVGGDFSGVQDFIYRLTSRGALKALRGRSFFLELLTQHAVAELLEATGVSWANVLYAAGAQFALLLPNTSKAPAEITRVRQEVNTYLAQVHGAKLFLVLECKQLNDDGLGCGKEGWEKQQRQLAGAIEGRKNRKFAEFDNVPHEELGDHETCSRCGASAVPVPAKELARWGLPPERYAPLCRFCFLLVPKSPREQLKPENCSPLQPLSSCRWCKAAHPRPVLFLMGEEVIAGCKHEFCLGEMREDECEVCHRYTLLSPLPTPDVQKFMEGGEIPERVWACPFCRNLYHLGEHLPDLQYVCRSCQEPVQQPREPAQQPRMLFKIGRWLYEFPESGTEFAEKLATGTDARGWIINNREARRYAALRPIAPLSVGNYHPKINDAERQEFKLTGEQKALDFSHLTSTSIGSHLIGALRMDVDNLGEVFSRKLPEHARTLTRTTALSRLLTRFFSEFMNALCEGKGLPPGQTGPFRLFPAGCFKVKGRPEQDKQAAQKRWVIIVYSGGDDLFIVGAWSEVIELAFDIHAAFRHYVCDHPTITLSGGMLVQHEDFPLYQLARLAKEAVDKAKKNEAKEQKRQAPHSTTKDSFAPFSLARPPVLSPLPDQKPLPEAFFWDEAYKLRSLAIDLVTHLKENQEPTDQRLHLKVPKAFLTQLFEIVELYEREGKLYLPRLHYALARHNILPELQKRLRCLDTIRYLHPALVWIDLLSRKEEFHVGR